MYQAKTAGRNTYRQYESAMTEQILLQASLEADLRLALDREELMVYYQPILDVISGGLVGAEAVSYTHLDVYTRQAQHLPAIRIGHDRADFAASIPGG